MDRAQEVRHLLDAERHIQQALGNVAVLEKEIAASAGRGEDVSQARGSLVTMQQVLVTFVEQRDAILQTIADIDAGKYGSA